MSILTQRQEIILFSIVDDFLKVMMPISSKHLIEKYRLDISSATVRNECVRMTVMDLDMESDQLNDIIDLKYIQLPPQRC